MAKPTYSLGDIKFLIREGAWQLATSRCRDSVQALALTQAQAADLLLLLEERDFRKVFGPCDNDWGRHIGDAYALWVDLDTMQRCRPTHDHQPLYVKVAVDVAADDPTDMALLIISFHY